MRTRIAAERVMDVPADVVYHCLADYREHHRPGGFLPPVFSDFTIEDGGVGAGTRASWVVNVGGRPRRVSATITEPNPGRTLVETAQNLQTVFTVEPTDRGTRVRFDTVMEEGGVSGVMTRLFAPRLLRPVYEGELTRLEDYARAHGRSVP
jgi:hypothetical protein